MLIGSVIYWLHSNLPIYGQNLYIRTIKIVMLNG